MQLSTYTASGQVLVTVKPWEPGEPEPGQLLDRSRVVALMAEDPSRFLGYLEWFATEARLAVNGQDMLPLLERKVMENTLGAKIAEMLASPLLSSETKGHLQAALDSLE